MEDNFFKTRRLQLPGIRGPHATQREIGDALGITSQSVTQWELDQTTPPVSRSADLAKAYCVPESRILKEIAKQAKRIREARTSAVV